MLQRTVRPFSLLWPVVACYLTASVVLSTTSETVAAQAMISSSTQTPMSSIVQILPDPVSFLTADPRNGQPGERNLLTPADTAQEKEE